MNRRTALLTSMFLGGLVPGSLHAQGQGRRLAVRDKTADLPSSDRDDPGTAVTDAELPADGSPGARLQVEKWDISRYTRLRDHQAPPRRP